MPMDTLKLTYAQIFKVDEAKREVYGIATEEVPDSESEMMDYDTSKQYFQAWMEHTSEVTAGKSMGAVRYMHQLDACGKLIHVEFDDEKRRITVGAKIVDDSIWTKIVEGVLTGFSIGGRALKKWKDALNSSITRFTVDPIEVSVVDVPCLPTAVFEYIKADGSVESKTFKSQEEMMPNEQLSEFGNKLDRIWSELQDLKKADGAKTKRVAGEDLGPDAFAYVGDKDDPSTWKLPIKFSSEEKTKRHIRNALARFNQTKGIPDGEKEKVHSKIVAAAKKHGIEAEGEEKKAQAITDLMTTALTKAMESKGVTKSLGNISELVYILQSLQWVKMDADWEAEYEGGDGDDRDAALAVEIRASMEHIIEILKEMVDEETSELVKAAELAKSAGGEDMDISKGGSFRAHFKKAAGMYEKECDMHKAMCEMHKAKAEEHKAGAASGLEEMKAMHKSLADVHKAKADHHEAMADMCKSHADHLRKMEDALSDNTDKSGEPDTTKTAQEEVDKGKKPDADEDDKNPKKDPDGGGDDSDKDGKKPEKAVEPPDTKAADGSQKEENDMTVDEVKNLIQDAITALDLNKTVSEAVTAGLAAQLPTAVETSVKAEVAKAVPPKVELPPVFAVPRVDSAKAADFQPLKGDNDNGW